MKDAELERLILAERNRSLPRSPSSMEVNVLRRIRLEQGDGEGFSALDWLWGLSRKGVMAGALALTVFLSTGASIFVSSSYLSSMESRELASQALDFDVLRDIHSLELDH